MSEIGNEAMRKWFFVLSSFVLALYALFSPFLLYSNAVSAYAPPDTLEPESANWKEYVNTQIGEDLGADWQTELNYALVFYPSEICGIPACSESLTFVAGEDYDEAPDAFTIEDGELVEGYETTVIGGPFVCRFAPDLTGDIVCNKTSEEYTGGVVQAGYVYALHLTDRYQEYLAEEQPELLEYYADYMKPRIRPEFTYTVNGKSVQAKDYNQTLPTFEPDEGYTIAGYSVEWSLFKCATLELGTCSDPDIVDHQIQPQDNYYNGTVEEYGNYQLQAQYLVQQCFRYASYPATPDYCFYVDLGVKLPDYFFTSTAVDLIINGDVISGDTKDGDCDISGHCEPPSIYEDCGQYGGEAPFGIGGGSFPDIIGGFTCVIGNFGKWLIEAFKGLFIPKASFWESWTNRLSSFLDEKLGFVYTAVTFIVDLFNGIIAGISTTSCTLSPEGELFGVEVEFDVCLIEDMNPTVFGIIQSLIIGITVIGLYFAGLHKYHQVLEQR